MYNDEEVTWFKWTPYLYAHTISLNKCIDSLCLDTHITWVTFKGCLWDQVGSRRSKGMKVDDRAKVDALFKNDRPFYPNVPNDSYPMIEFFRTVHIHSKLLSSLYANHRPVFVFFLSHCPLFDFRTVHFHVPRTVHFDSWSSNFSLNTLAIWPKIKLTIPIENELGGWVTLIKIVIIVRTNN